MPVIVTKIMRAAALGLLMLIAVPGCTKQPQPDPADADTIQNAVEQAKEQAEQAKQNSQTNAR